MIHSKEKMASNVFALLAKSYYASNAVVTFS